MYAILATYCTFALLRIFYQIAAGFLYVRPTRKPLLRKNHPLVSVIIPAWNEEVGIAKTIRSVMASNYRNIEVIVVDDGSTDGTAESVLRLKRSFYRNGDKVRLISQANTGKAGALNTGIAAANGEYVVTLDADSYLAKQSIRELLRALADNTYSVAIGEVVIGNTKTLLGKAQHYEYLVGFHFKRSQHIFNSAYIFPGALTMFRTSVLHEIGAFTDYSSTEDLDISMRIKSAGHKVAYVDTAVCTTEGAASYKGLLDQRARWRHGFIECMLHRADFVWSTSKGKYLSFVDLPLNVIGTFEILLFPLVIGFLIFQLILHPQPLTIIASYLLLPFVLLLLSDIRGDKSTPLRSAPIMPFALLTVNAVEYIALLKALYRTIRRKKTAWTVWQRTGASS